MRAGLDAGAWEVSQNDFIGTLNPARTVVMRRWRGLGAMHAHRPERWRSFRGGRWRTFSWLGQAQITHEQRSSAGTLAKALPPNLHSCGACRLDGCSSSRAGVP
jgi:hypothetical protein